MKYIFPTIAAFVILTAATVVAAQAQTPAQAAPIKLAIVDTDAFGNPAAGIKRLIDAYGKLQTEIKPKQDEIATLRTRYDQMIKELNEGRTVADTASLRAKAEQAETLKRDIERKQQDGQTFLDRRAKELTGPINTDLGNALQAFAKQRGYDLVLDASKFAGTMIILNQAIDITAAFIAEYNSRNPAAPARP